MRILAIDPGPKINGYVLYEPGLVKILDSGEIGADAMCATIHFTGCELIAIERIRGYGMVSGDDTFDTCENIGRFYERATFNAKTVRLIPRKDIKRFLCGNTTTNDKYVREALIDRLEDPQFITRDKKGTKKILKGGRLYSISGHCWAALAVAVTASEIC
jgi:hypothetical protein